MKKINKSVLLSFLSLVILNAFNTSVFADGGYNPYGPHIPEDTGIADAKMFIIVAIIAYTLGLTLIAASKFIKNKAEK